MSEYKNIMEDLVLEEFENAAQTLGCCTCEDCRNDIIAYALNQLPPKYVAKSHFLKDVLITETMLAVSRQDDLDYVFAHLLPSYFGMDYAETAEEVYRGYKQSRIEQDIIDQIDTEQEEG